jgi:enoyl-CoA hydratase
VARRRGLLEQVGAVLALDAPAEAVVDHVGLERVGPVALITLARPEQHNVISLGGWRRIAAAARDLAEDPTLRLVLVRGAGERAFGTGADIKEFPGTRMTPAHALDYNEAIAHALQGVETIPVPVVAVIDGLAVGGGLELSAACDLRIASDTSHFGLPIGRLGVTLGYTEADALARLVGPAELMYLLVSGRLIDASDALRIGLVQRVVGREDLTSEVLGLLESVITASLPTLLAAKAVVAMTTRPLTARDTERLARITVEVYGGADLAEGVAAFTDRRPPRFPSQDTTADLTGEAI